ncbi:hypothetical protein [Streptomyces laurentii]
MGTVASEAYRFCGVLDRSAASHKKDGDIVGSAVVSRIDGHVT